jgi:hypothetical protein
MLALDSQAGGSQALWVQELHDWLLAPFHPWCGRNRLVGCIGSAQQFFSSALSSKRLLFAPAKPGSAETVGSHVSLEPGCRSTFACRERGSVAGTGNQTSDSCTPWAWFSLVQGTNHAHGGWVEVGPCCLSGCTGAATASHSTHFFPTFSHFRNLISLATNLCGIYASTQ